MRVKKSARIRKLSTTNLSVKAMYFFLVYLKLLVPLFLTVFLLYSILFPLVVNIDLLLLMPPGMRRLLKLGPINKSHLHYGYPMPVIVYVLPV
jgi:hypothetical protein